MPRRREPLRPGSNVVIVADVSAVFRTEPASVRTELGGTASAVAGTTLLSLVHLTDLHILDAASPARGEWVELEAADPLYRPLLHMHRPYDALTLSAVAAHVETIRAQAVGPASGRPFDLAISTGDNIDNAQRNELDAYLALIAGGTAQLSAHGCAQDAARDAARRPWPYWSPDPAVADLWRDRGYPEIDDFLERASAPVRSPGLGLPWASVPGNHDLMRQGTALTTRAVEAIAVGSTKSLSRPVGFSPADPSNTFLDAPESFSDGPAFAIEPDPDRRAIDRAEWIAAHVVCGALGYSQRNVDELRVDTVVDTEHVRFVLLDTNHPEGDFDGSIGVGQLAWLDEQLAEVDAQPGRLAVLVSHHGADTLVNERHHPADRRLAASMNEVVHRHPSAIAWLAGHRHINRIEPRPGSSGGYWEITTSSTIDWPSQTRAVEITRHRDGSLELICTMLDHRDEPDGLASIHRRLARLFMPDRAIAHMGGRELDRDVRLVLPPRG